MKIRRIPIADRGEIAMCVIRTARRLGKDLPARSSESYARVDTVGTDYFTRFLDSRGTAALSEVASSRT